VGRNEEYELVRALASPMVRLKVSLFGPNGELDIYQSRLASMVNMLLVGVWKSMEVLLHIMK